MSDFVLEAVCGLTGHGRDRSDNLRAVPTPKSAPLNVVTLSRMVESAGWPCKSGFRTTGSP